MANYDGKVVPGGPWQTRTLNTATIRKRAVSATNNNVYTVTDHASGHQVLIDAAADWELIYEMLADLPGPCTHIVTTHSHRDHVRALPEAVEHLQVPTYAGHIDAPAIPVETTNPLKHGDQISCGESVFDVVELRGHTPGSIALVLTDTIEHIFIGDALFPGGLGNTKDKDQCFDSLYRDVTTRIFDVYGDQTHIYPGHGHDTTLGAERGELPTWRARGW